MAANPRTNVPQLSPVFLTAVPQYQPGPGHVQPNALTMRVPFDLQHLPMPNPQLLERLAEPEAGRDVTIQHSLIVLRNNLVKLNHTLGCFSQLRIAFLNNLTQDRQATEALFTTARANEEEIWRMWYWVQLQANVLGLKPGMRGDEGQLAVECMAQKTMLKWYAADVIFIQEWLARFPRGNYAPRPSLG